MFEARLTNASTLKKIVESIKDLVSEVNLEASPTGISMQAMDSSHVALVCLDLQCGGFEEYRCDRNMALGMSIANLSKIIKCCGNDDIVTLKAEEDPSVITFTFEGKNQDKISEFNLNLLNIDTEQLGIPETDYKATVSCSSGEFSRVCRELSQISDSVTIDVTKESVNFGVTSQEVGKGSVTLRSNDSEKPEDQVLLEVEEPVSLGFALRYLNLFNKSATLSPTVNLSLSPDVPLVVEYEIKDLGSLKFYLAPKISDE